MPSNLRKKTENKNYEILPPTLKNLRRCTLIACQIDKALEKQSKALDENIKITKQLLDALNSETKEN